MLTLRNKVIIYTRVVNLKRADFNYNFSKTFLLSKYKQEIENNNIIEKNNKTSLRQTYQTILSKNTSHSTIFQNLKQILAFLNKFSNSDGKIDVELAKNIFPKRSRQSPNGLLNVAESKNPFANPILPFPV